MNTATTRGALSLSSVIFVVLLILKLTGTATITWLWVFSPYWIPFVAALAIVICIFIVATIAAGIDFLFNRNES
jgi:hypothetical protein